MPDLKRLKGFKDKVADSAASVADSAQGTLQKTSEKMTDTASSVAGAVQDASQRASVKATDVAASAVWSTQDALQEASEKVTDTAASVAGSAQDTLQKTSEQVTDTASSVAGTIQDASSKASVKATDVAASAVWSAQDTSEKVTDTAASAAGAVRETAQKAPDVATAAAESVKTTPKAVLKATTSAANALLSTTQGLLASDLSGVVNDLLQGMVKGVPTIYDKAMDTRFIETGIGGTYHRLFDGGHTIAGAWNAVRGASPDDNIVQEALGGMLGLLRDVSTPRGLPLATWDKETFDQVAATLDSSFRIPKSWLYDLNTFDAAELFSSSIGAVALIFNWNRADTETFARFAGSMGVSSALGANPLLLVVTVVALARAFQKARRTGEYADFVDGQARGGLTSGATLAAVGLVGVTGGPAGMALLVALVTGILVSKATEKVSIVQVGLVVARQAIAAAAEAKGMIAQQVPVIA